MSASDKQKPKQAAALRYEHGRDQAPKVVAKGRGKIAQRIIELARRHQVPLVEDASLANLLDALEVDSDIPPELYRAVAEVLVFVYRLNRGAR